MTNKAPNNDDDDDDGGGGGGGGERSDGAGQAIASLIVKYCYTFTKPSCTTLLRKRLQPSEQATMAMIYA